MLATIDADHRLFGARTHEYQLAPPLTEAELAALEAELGPLPVEYRGFLRSFAAHGAGPHYGLLEPRPPAEPRDGVVPEPARARDRKSTRLNSSHSELSRMPSSA